MSLRYDLLQAGLSEVLRTRTAFVETFYKRLFARDPEIEQLFAHTNMAVQHTRFLLSVLNVLDRHTPQTLEEVTGNLTELGRRHHGYGVRAEHYMLLGEVLLETLEEFLGEQWTPEVKQAWQDAYDLVSQAMLAAPRDDQPVGHFPDEMVQSKLRWWLGL